MSAIYITYGEDPLALGRELIEASGAAKLFKRGGSAAVKPNLVVAKPASGGATTHAGFAEAALEAARDAGVSRLYIIEGAWLGEDTRRAFSACGYDALAKRFGARLVDLKRDASVNVSFKGEKALVCKSALEMDALVNLPVLKAHCQTRMTCAIKNLKGCIPDSEKRRYHAEGLFRPISRLPGLIPTTFTLVDGLCGDLTFEEGGTPVPMGLAFLSRDPVAADAMAAQMLGLALSDVPYIGMAESLGLGSASGLAVHPLREPHQAPSATFAAETGARRLSRLTPYIHENAACSACYGSLVRALHILSEQGRSLPDVSVGQGFRGRSGDGIGVGRCCAGFSSAIPGCPPDARIIAETLAK